MSLVDPYDSILKELESGSTVVTATRRLSRELQIRYSNMMATSDSRVWDSPDVLPWHAWLRRLWDEQILAHRGPVPTLLSDTQARAWWEDAVQSSVLMQSSGAAKTAYQAWQLLADYQVPLADLKVSQGVDSKLFRDWAQAYEQTCRDKNWLDPAYLIQQLHVSDCSSRIVFAGFDQFAPAQQSFFETLRKNGTQVETWLPRLTAKSMVRLVQPDGPTELLSAARFCRQRLLKNSSETVGVVVPDLNQQRSHVEQVFSSVLAPIHDLTGEQRQPLPFHISYGRPLSSFGLIQAALQTLRLVQGDVSYGELLSWLRSPYIGQEQLASRAKLESSVRRTGRYSWQLDSFRDLLKENGLPHFESVEPLLNSMSKRNSGSYWARWCSDVLAVFQWPGEAPFTQQDRQLLRRWLNLLDQTAARELVLGEISCRDFVSTLTRLARESVFESRSTGAPIQIMGVLEASGLYFDHLWVTGLTDDTWPRKAPANPFVSTEVRKAFGLPGASPMRDLRAAQDLNDRLLGSGRKVLLSHPQRFHDEPLRPSPLIAQIEEVTETFLDLGSSRSFVEQLMIGSKTEVVDDYAPALHDAQASGGASLLKAQSACPFRGFAQYRLYATDIDVPVPGFDPRQRGNFVHDLMQRIWDRLQDKNTLMSWTPQALDKFIREAAKATLVRDLSDSDESIRRLAELELDRIVTLVTQQLELEKQRPDFRVVATEEQQRLTLGKLHLSLRIDRIDASDDDLFLVDYKTGNADANQWTGERPAEPQMLVYARLFSDTLAGLVFAKVKAGDISFNGVTREKGQFPGVQSLTGHRSIKTASWAQLLAQWERITDGLASDFVNGVADVDPQDHACDYCHLSGLCRIAESAK